MTLDLGWLFHNVVVHPVAGVLWFVGLTAAGDWVHDCRQRPAQENA